MVSTTNPRCTSDFEGRHVVAVSEPLLDERNVDRCGRRALLVDDAHRRVDDVGVALVEHEQHVRVAGVVRAVGLDRVVEPQHGRRRAALHDAAHRVEGTGERVERVRGAALGGRTRMDAQARPDDDAECPLGADEELVEIGPDGGARCAAGRDRACRRRGRRRDPGRCPRSSRSASRADPRRDMPPNRRRSTARWIAASVRS